MTATRALSEINGKEFMPPEDTTIDKAVTGDTTPASAPEGTVPSETEITVPAQEGDSGTPADNGEKKPSDPGTIPAWRLKQESEKRREAEAETARLRSELAARNAPATAPANDWRKTLRSQMKVQLNEETGEYEFTDGAIETMARMMHGVVTQVASGAKRADAKIAQLKEKHREDPYFKELEPQIDSFLEYVDPSVKLETPDIVDYVYNYSLGQKIKNQKMATNQGGEPVKTAPTRPVSQSVSLTPKSKTLTPTQQEEFKLSFEHKSFTPETYLELLSVFQKQDKAKGKIPRETVHILA